MVGVRKPARINVKALLITCGIVVLLGVAAVVGHYVRKHFIATHALADGRAALAREDWAAACKHLKRYLEKRPEDPEILLAFGRANLRVRPLQPGNLGPPTPPSLPLVRPPPRRALCLV